MSSALQTVTRLDGVVAFDTPGVTTGVELFTIPSGALVINMWVFCESATNSGAGQMDVLAGDYGIGGTQIGPRSPEPSPIEQTDRALLGSGQSMTFTQSGGTWTAGSIRVVVVILEAA